MKCPSCGAPNVILHKDIWECGWCGDSGPIPRRFFAQRDAARQRQEAWWQEAAATARWAAQTITESAEELLPGRKDAAALAWKAILCQASTGLIESRLWAGVWGDKEEQAVSGRIFYPYLALANDLADSSGISSSAAIGQAIRSGRPLFQPEGQLTAAACGEFWELMIEQLPPYDKEEPSMQNGDLCMNRGFGVGSSAAHKIEKILCCLLPLASLFAGDEGDSRDNRYLGYFTGHWKRLRGEKVDSAAPDDTVVARIAEQFPELRDEYDSTNLLHMSGAELLEEIYHTDPQRAIAMWRSLPEKQEPLSEPCRADDFFGAIDFLWDRLALDAEDFVPLLDAVQTDDVLAQMVFRSACVCDLQLKLLEAAVALGRPALAEHLYALLQTNPLSADRWGKYPEEFRAVMERDHTSQPEAAKAAADAKDTAVYRYCSVQVGSSRPYAYLAAGLPVKRGDRVRVPYGKKNAPQEGVVRSVEDHTRGTAPWPPEKTKRVLEILPQPQETAAHLPPPQPPILGADGTAIQQAK